jgi:two-component system chemotaxis response regulator CheB
MKKIRVLVVDDSLLFREVLAKGIAGDPAVEVVATASDPFEARDKIIEFAPDVMTCDVQMPKMNGIEFLRRLLPQYPLPVIMITAVTEAVFDAMAAGAVDFVTKPEVRRPDEIQAFIGELVAKIKIAAVARITKTGPTIAINRPTVAAGEKIIAVGASTGGTEALFNLIKAMPPIAPMVIVQHIPPVFSRMFAERLNASTSFKVSEARTGDRVERGRVLIAPGDKHMRLKKADGKYFVECFRGAKVNGHCPSVDILFESVAKEVRTGAIGVILTGMGYDGAKGLLAMRRAGARTIGQSEASCVVYGMPKVAYNIGAVEKVAPLENIPSLLCALMNG